MVVPLVYDETRSMSLAQYKERKYFFGMPGLHVYDRLVSYHRAPYHWLLWHSSRHLLFVAGRVYAGSPVHVVSLKLRRASNVYTWLKWLHRRPKLTGIPVVM